MRDEFDLPEMLTIHEVAQKLNVNYMTVFRWIKNGEIEAVRIGSKIWRIPRGSYLSLIALEEHL